MGVSRFNGSPSPSLPQLLERRQAPATAYRRRIRLRHAWIRHASIEPSYVLRDISLGSMLATPKAEPCPMRILTLSAIALIGAGFIAGQAVAANFGSLTLKAGETQNVHISIAYNMRVCNDFNSSGSVVATISGNVPHDLQPGRCAEDIGDRIVFQSHASGPAMVDFRAIIDDQGHHQFDD